MTKLISGSITLGSGTLLVVEAPSDFADALGEMTAEERS
jgi:hypothetical protein